MAGNASVPATVIEQATRQGQVAPSDKEPVVKSPVKINMTALRNLGAQYRELFERFSAERTMVEQRWLRNLRQIMGVYDPEIESQLHPKRSRAYPRITRVKCITMLARLMNLMFPGNEDNWEISASPSPEMDPEEVLEAVKALMARLEREGAPAPLTQDLVNEAVRDLAAIQAQRLTALIKDQLLELGGDQTTDWVTLNRKVADSAIKFGIGVLEGPFVRKVQQSGWMLLAEGGFKPVTREVYKPQYDNLPVWDFYPDLSARKLPGEGYFVRKVLGRSKFRKLGERPDFFKDQVKKVITNLPDGNYKAKSWETELRSMGTAINVDFAAAKNAGRAKYEIIVWKGPVSGDKLAECGVDVPEKMRSDDVNAEIWMVDDHIIKAEINAWTRLGVDLQQVHIFEYDEDDTSPIGQGLPYTMRDSALSVAACTRMILDNASVTCGPNLEINTTLLRGDQDLTNVEAYKIWYRDDDGLTAQYPAVRSVEIQGHLSELQGLMQTFLQFAEIETLIGPQTGHDMTKVPSEAMRTAAGNSMLRSDAALPFKDIVRNYDAFTQSVIWSLIGFNEKYNPDLAPKGDFDVIPRGATSLISKEVRGTQIDFLSQTLTPEERDHVDERKFVEAKFSARDMQGMLVTPDEAERRKQQRAAQMAEQADLARREREGGIKKLATEAFKDITQGQKNAAAGDKTAVEAAMKLIEGDPTNDTGSSTPKKS